MHRLGRRMDPGDVSAVVSANMHFAFLDAVLFAGVSWCEGHDPMIQLVGPLSNPPVCGRLPRCSVRGTTPWLSWWFPSPKADMGSVLTNLCLSRAVCPSLIAWAWLSAASACKIAEPGGTHVQAC